MNRYQEIEFSKKRIIEQNEYIRTTARKKITQDQKRELLFSAIVVRKRFRSRLCQLLGLTSYVAFKLFEEY